MILSGHAPCYLPGIQLFNKIALSDVFMHCGHLKYEPRTWHSHNFIRTCRLTVPVHKTFGERVNQVTLAEGSWRRKQLKAIEDAYKGFRYFDRYFPVLAEIINGEYSFLSTLNQAFMRWILHWLGIETLVSDSAQWHFEGDAIDKIIAMCRAVGADEYLSNEGSRAYIGHAEEQRMKEAGITPRWQKFEHPFYGQELTINHGRLSVIDLLFRHGPEARPIIEHSGQIA